MNKLLLCSVALNVTLLAGLIFFAQQWHVERTINVINKKIDAQLECNWKTT